MAKSIYPHIAIVSQPHGVVNVFRVTADEKRTRLYQGAKHAAIGFAHGYAEAMAYQVFTYHCASLGDASKQEWVSAKL